MLDAKIANNSFGGRTIQGKHNHENHACPIPVPDSKKFTKDRLEYIKHGPWTSLENSIFLLIIEDFKSYSKRS